MCIRKWLMRRRVKKQQKIYEMLYEQEGKDIDAAVKSLERRRMARDNEKK